MSIVYKKSLKGVEELALRCKGLQLRLRVYLLLVNGVNSDHELQERNKALPEVEMVLAALYDEGYLQIVSQNDIKSTYIPPAEETMPFQVPQVPTSNSASTTADINLKSFNEPVGATNSSANQIKFLQARDNLVREITLLLGKDAEMVVAKIQRCENGMDLFAMMMGLKKIIGMYAGNEKAEQFATKFSFVSTL